MGCTDLDSSYNYHDADVLLSAENLSFTYQREDKVSCLINDIQLNPGKVYVLCGKSGSGKSTFLKLINGLIPDYFQGQIEGFLRVLSHRIGEDSVEVLSNDVASVFQNPSSQFFYERVKHELVFPCENKGMSTYQIEKKLNQLLSEFHIEDLLNRQLRSLSGGQRQLVAIATAIMQSTALIILDEPTANLDHDGCEIVKQKINYLKSQGISVIIAEHRLNYLIDVADEFLYFENGVLNRQFSINDLLSLENKERKELGLRAFKIPAIWDYKKDKMCAQFYFKDDEYVISQLAVKAGQDLLQSYQKLSFKKGQITSIIGKNGIGKSRLANYLSGLLEDKNAHFMFDGKSLSQKERLQKTAFVMQEVQLQLVADSVINEVNLGHKPHPNTDAILETLNLHALKEKHPMTLSGGEQQRLMIAASLLSDKEIFIFDEPSCGLDLLQMKAVAKLLIDLKQEGKIVILISHDVELLSLVSDRIYQIQ
ncbi:hypothetical protein HMPREF9318_00295 [Streptococcus urinalis FB127-CNA-2]|nr:hypothetical protein HMPREF9318_00295 [Streptococcus urinalis FB127-CNA-2]VEF31909.1 ABC transporter ATP-binding protein [Streptococcus urinalis]